MNQPQLNPDALRRAADAVTMAAGACGVELYGADEDIFAERAVSAYLAAALPEVTSVEAIPGEKLAAQIILRVDVMLGFDPGTNTPNAFELPYEYLVIRGAEVLKSEAIIQSGIFQVVGEGVFDDADPDSVLVEAVTHGLSSLAAASPEVRP